MNAQMKQFQLLVLKELDPTYFNMDEGRLRYWLNEIPLLKDALCDEMQAEMLGSIASGLLERHLKQVQYDCFYLMGILEQYIDLPGAALVLKELAFDTLEEIMTLVENRYGGFFILHNGQVGKTYTKEPDVRIRVAFSAGVLAYFFKLLHKAGGLDTGSVMQLIVALSKNFVTTGIGEGQLSVNGLTTRYKNVVQTSAKSLRALLVRMLKHLDDEFNLG